MLSEEIVQRVTQWLEEAKTRTDLAEPAAMNVATATRDGKPSSRVLLLKGFDARGFVFYTNNESRKGGQLKQNPWAALCFHWMPMQRQLRVEGRVEPVTEAEADAYFASRARESRIGAWASDQSRPVDSYDTLMRRVAEYARKFEGKDVPRPPHWLGWRVIPDYVEFWQEGEYRLHRRDVYRLYNGAWEIVQLYP